MKQVIWKSLVLMVVLLTGMLSGCGDKIEIPVAEGDFGLIDYALSGELLPDHEIRQIKFSPVGLHVLGPDQVKLHNINFDVADSTEGLNDARAICVDISEFLLFIWEEGSHQVSWYDAFDLTLVGSREMPDVSTAVDMVTNDAGIEQAPWASTFLYISDPVQEVVHRFAFDRINGLVPHGILTRADGDAARFVHDTAGLVTDSQNRLLVCDQDPARNWVIRFDSAPDTLDLSTDPNIDDPLRGLAFPFKESLCEVPPAGDFVLGYAFECGGETPWQGRPSDIGGEFDRPTAVAVAGNGNLFVTDTGNDRIQMFDFEGEFILEFGSTNKTPDPLSLGVIDQVTAEGQHYGAYVFVHLGIENKVLRFISIEHKEYLNRENPVELE